MKTISPPPPEEYDFNNLLEQNGWSEEEAVACLFYEIGRKSVTVGQLIKLWQKHSTLLSKYFKKNTDILELLKPLEEADQNQIGALAASCFRITLLGIENNFCAWFKIPEAKRKKALRDLRCDELPQILKSRRKRNQGRELSAISAISFNVNWGDSDKALLIQFKRWLKEHRPTPPFEMKPGTVYVPRNLLNQLRLKRLYDFSAHRIKALIDLLDKIEHHQKLFDEKNIRKQIKKLDVFISEEEALLRQRAGLGVRLRSPNRTFVGLGSFWQFLIIEKQPLRAA